MNQERIGKFIAMCRKEKKITQTDLAEQLGVTDRSVSNWETGKNMPDLSLFKPLCEVLGITINELLSGEKISQEKYQERLEENIVNTIDYSTKKMDKYSGTISLLFILFGLFISLSALVIFSSESSWSSIYSVVGIIIFMIGIARSLKPIKWLKRFLLLIAIFLGTMGVLFFADYVNVKYNKEAPMFRFITATVGDVMYYDTLFYDVYRCHFNEENEYWVIEKKKKLTMEELLDYCK